MERRGTDRCLSSAMSTCTTSLLQCCAATSGLNAGAVENWPATLKPVRYTTATVVDKCAAPAAAP